MKDIKVNLSISIPGRIMYSEEEAEAMPNNKGYELTKVTLNGKKGKRDILNVLSRGCKPVTQSININRDAYDYMCSDTPAKNIKPNIWKKMKREKRLIAHLEELCESLGGTSFTYKIFDD